VTNGVHRALLIGNSEFPDDPHNLRPLHGPVNDLQLLCGALTDPTYGLFDRDHVRILPERTKRHITEAMEAFFVRAGPDDTLLLYYTGHGFPNEYDELFMCARDTRVDLLVSTAISDLEIDGMMRRSSAKRFVVLLDCCSSGGFKSGSKLPPKLKGAGRFVIMSSRQNEPSRDAPTAYESSTFTRHLVDALRGGADADGDGYVSVSEVYNYVAETLPKETKQIPTRHFDHGAYGDPALARSAPPKPAAVGALPHQAAMSMWSDRPRLTVEPPTIEHRDVGRDEQLPVEIVNVLNEGGGELDWEAKATADWIDVRQFDTYCELTLNPRPGMNRGTLHVRDRGRGGSATVRLLVEVRQIEPAPRLEVVPAALEFGPLKTNTESPARTLQINNRGGGALDARVSTSDPRLQLDRADDILTVRIDTANAGEVKGDVVVDSAGGSQTIPVTAIVEPGPLVAVKPAAIDFGRVVEGKPQFARLTVSNQGSGRLSWKHGSSGDFFEVRRMTGALELKLIGRPGRHLGSIWIQSNGGEATVDVRAEVRPKPKTKPARKDDARSGEKRASKKPVRARTATHEPRVDALAQLLKKGSTDAADAESIRLIRTASGHQKIDSAKKAADVPADLILAIDAVWRKAGRGGLEARPWVSLSTLGAQLSQSVTTFVKWSSWNSWLKLRVDEVKAETSGVAKVTDDTFAALRRYLAKKELTKADAESKRLIRHFSGHTKIDSEKKAAALRADFLRQLDDHWRLAGSGLRLRPWVTTSSDITTNTGWYSIYTWIEKRLRDIGR
jgi:Caspase domain